MKNILFFLIGIMMVIATSCKKDDCEPGSLSETLIGEWSVSLDGDDLGDVEFEEDGTLVDPDGILIGGENGLGEPLEIKTYALDGEDAISTSASDGTNSITVEYAVTDFSCDEVTLEFFGQESKLRRN